MSLALSLGCRSGLVNKSFPTPLNEQKREKNLAPVLNCTVDTTNLQAILCVVYVQLFLAASAFEQIARGSLAFPSLVIDANFRLAEARCVIEPVCSLQGFHAFTCT